MSSPHDLSRLRSENLCGLCGAGEFTRFLALGPQDTWAVRCRRCHQLRTYPYPFDAATDGVDVSPLIEAYARDEKLYRHLCQSLLAMVREVVPPGGRHVDIGCGPGYFVDEMNQAGYQSLGLDFDRQSLEFGQKRGYPLHFGGLDQIESGSVQVLTASHTLEHIFSLHEVLAEIHRVLAPGGYLIVSQPNYDSWMGRLGGAQWYGWVPSQHHWHFDERSLRAALESGRFRVREIRHFAMHLEWPPIRLIRHPRTFVRRWATTALARLALTSVAEIALTR